MPRLSELPDFLPAGEAGSPERLACALGTFTNEKVNAQFMRFARRLATQPTPTHPSSHAAPVLERLAHGQ